jgi:hypothetical protein
MNIEPESGDAGLLLTLVGFGDPRRGPGFWELSCSIRSADPNGSHDFSTMRAELA